MHAGNHNLQVIHPDVQAAIVSGTPIVALESALITHGLPYTLNLETAEAMEREVQHAGAVPATIAVIDGRIHVGLDNRELGRLAATPHPIKVSSRGIAHAVATGQTAGTTVSGTMCLARMAGIRFFGTGGLGGVHHGAAESGDISTDLTEIARTPIAVISSGVKSILDIGRTLEYLETAGVPVFCYATDSFPAFFSGEIRFPAPARLDDAHQAAQVCRIHWELGLPSGILVACPPPVRVEDQSALDRAIDQANREAFEQRVQGSDVTPFVLRRVAELTGGMSVRVNMALLKNNARIAAEIAVAAERT